MEKIVTLSEEQLNQKDLAKDLANVTSEENRMVVKCMLIVTTIFLKIKAIFYQGLTRRYEATEYCLKTFP